MLNFQKKKKNSAPPPQKNNKLRSHFNVENIPTSTFNTLISSTSFTSFTFIF